MNDDALRTVLEAALLAAGRPLAMDDLLELFGEGGGRPERREIRAALASLEERWSDGALELAEVAGGFRAQIRAAYSPWLGVLWSERPARYSRALLETLAIIAYRQPVTRGEIEEIRGVSVSTSIMKTLYERGWVRELGHREVPGRPVLLGTTRAFLEHFGLATLSDLPPLVEVAEEPAGPDDLFGAEPRLVAVPAGGGPDAPSSATAASGTDAGDGGEPGDAPADPLGEPGDGPGDVPGETGPGSGDAPGVP